MQIGVIGLNHKLAELKLREKIAKACDLLFGTQASLFKDYSTVLLSTCNRTEIYFFAENLAYTHTEILNKLRHFVHEREENFDQKLYSYFGNDCFAHLARVTSGLDSAIIGETEIQGQVKAAYEQAVENTKQFPSELHYLFQKSLKIGKHVRSTFELCRNAFDIEHALIKLGNQIFPTIDSTKVLFVGASEINRKIIKFMKARRIHNITVCNRTQEKLIPFIEAFSVSTLNWKDLQEWPSFDWIIFGTKAPGYLIHKGACASRINSPKLIIDLCVPRNVDPLIGKHPHATLYNIDEINLNLSTRSHQISRMITLAENYVEESAWKHAELFNRKEKKTSLVLSFTG